MNLLCDEFYILSGNRMEDNEPASHTNTQMQDK